VAGESLVTFVRVKGVNGSEWYVNPAYVAAIEPPGTDAIVVILSTGYELCVLTDESPADEARRLAETMSRRVPDE
jgi:hypothetical protein